MYYVPSYIEQNSYWTVLGCKRGFYFSHLYVVFAHKLNKNKHKCSSISSLFFEEATLSNNAMVVRQWSPVTQRVSCCPISLPQRWVRDGLQSQVAQPDMCKVCRCFQEKEHRPGVVGGQCGKSQAERGAHVEGNWGGVKRAQWGHWWAPGVAVPDLGFLSQWHFLFKVIETPNPSGSEPYMDCFLTLLRVSLEIGEILLKSVFIQWMESVIKSLNLGVFFVFVFISFLYFILSHCSSGLWDGCSDSSPLLVQLNERAQAWILRFSFIGPKNQPPWSGRKETCWLAFALVLLGEGESAGWEVSKSNREELDTWVETQVMSERTHGVNAGRKDNQ